MGLEEQYQGFYGCSCSFSCHSLVEAILPHSASDTIQDIMSTSADVFDPGLRSDRLMINQVLQLRYLCTWDRVSLLLHLCCHQFHASLQVFQIFGFSFLFCKVSAFILKLQVLFFSVVTASWCDTLPGLSRIGRSFSLKNFPR